MKNNIEKKGKKGISNFLWTAAMIFFLCVFIVSCVKLFLIFGEYYKAEKAQEKFEVYKPEIEDKEPDPENTDNTEENTEGNTEENATLIELKNMYPDVCGWITIADTTLDYPIARSEDNDYYLNHTLDGQETKYGTPFLDFRCTDDFTGFNNIVYGHYMKTGKMFTHLSKFKEKEFFDTHNDAVLFLPNDTYQLQIMACLVVDCEDQVIYDPNVERDTFLSYIKSHAWNYRETEVEKDDVVLTLSTCSYEYDGARTVVVAKIGAVQKDAR